MHICSTSARLPRSGIRAFAGASGSSAFDASSPLQDAPAKVGSPPNPADPGYCDGGRLRGTIRVRVPEAGATALAVVRRPSPRRPAVTRMRRFQPLAATIEGVMSIRSGFCDCAGTAGTPEGIAD